MVLQTGDTLQDALCLTELVPGSPIPSRIHSITGEVAMLKDCEPGDPLEFGIFTKIFMETPEGTGAGIKVGRAVTMKFSTGSFIYPTDLSDPVPSLSTVNSSPPLDVARKFEEMMAFLRKHGHQDITVLLRPVVSKPHPVEAELLPSLVLQKERRDGTERYKISVELSHGLSIRGADGTVQELYKDTVAGWFGSSASSNLQATQNPPPCGQIPRFAGTPATTTDLSPAHPLGIGTNDPLTGVMAPPSDLRERSALTLPPARPNRPFQRTDLEESPAESSASAQARYAGVKRSSIAMGNDSGLAEGLEADFFRDVDAGMGSIKPLKRQNVALGLTSSDESNHQDILGGHDAEGEPHILETGLRARIPAGNGKENSTAAPGPLAKWRGRDTVKEESMEYMQRGRSVGAEQHAAGLPGLPPGRPAVQSSQQVPVGLLYRPRTEPELSAWAAEGPPTISLQTCQIVYRTMDDMGANEKTAPAGERLPASWNIVAVVNSVDIQPYRRGQDHLINLVLTDPTRHDRGDYVKFSLFSKTRFEEFPKDLGYGSIILIRNAHPNRWKGGRLMARCAAKETWSYVVLDRDNGFHYGAGLHDPRAGEGITAQERDYMRAMFDWQKVCHSGMNPAPYNLLYHGPRLGAHQLPPAGPALRIQLGQRLPIARIPEPKLSDPLPIECSKEVYTSHIGARESTISEVIACHTVPFHFRLKAPVVDTMPDALNWDKCVIMWCKSCEASFRTEYCFSCRDVQCENAVYRFRFWVILGEEDGPWLPVQIWQPHMPHVFPDLPKILPDQFLSGPELKETKRHMLDMLLGKRIDGERPRLPIDWSIESFWMRNVDGSRHRMFRAFDMT